MSSHHQHYAAVSDFVPAESWDDDFEFQQNNPHAHTNATTHPPKHKPKPAPMPPHEPLPRMSTTTTTSSHFAEDWDVEHDAQSPPQPPRPPPASIVVLEDKMNYYHHHNPHHRASQLADWAEPGPSTPTKRSVPSLTENWDDDFEDRTDSPARKSAASHPLDNARRSRHLTPSRVRRHAPPVQDQESWDDEFEAEKPHDGVDHSPGKRARRGACSDSSDEEGEFGFADKEEDRTVTARSHPRHAILARMTPPPPVPTLPSFLAMTSEPFPRSPVESVFSIPVSSTGHDHESVTYSSTAHLPLRPTLSVSSSALALLPPSPPIHRERRRLRKKSRPPQFDDNIFELEDRAEISVQTLLPPITPERVPSPPPTSPDPVSPSSNKNPLLSRIGSVKKWSVRKKRTSTTPSDTIPQENDGHDTTPRPPSSLSQSPVLANKPGNWFFRSSGGASPQYGSPPPTLGLSHSGDRIQYLNPSTVDETPDSPTKLIKRKSLGFSQIRKQLPVQELQPLAPKRPVSMLPDPKQRHASYAYGTHSSSEGPVPKVPGVESASVEDFGKGASQREGSRGFMSGVRKISFTGGQKKHKRRQSSAHSVAEAKASMPDDVQPLPHHGLQPLEPVEPPLPPIELQPPSPVSASGMQTSQSAPGLVSTGIGVVNIRTTSPPKAPPSPQTASLGRSTHAMAASAIVPRRNSLGDLKIPARISQAQVGLRRDLVMVREFAANVEQLKELQTTYISLIAEVQTLLNNRPPPSRATSPNFFNLPLPGSRHRSNTNPVLPQPNYQQIAASLYSISSKYRISWECAELLIELGGGTPSPMSPPSASVSAPVMHTDAGSADGRKGRERAITLAGDQSKQPPATAPSAPTARPPSLVWRASTGRHDLSQRQLVLLREMLNNPDSSLPEDHNIPEDSAPVNREWRWGDAMNSTITLPSQESVPGVSPIQKRRSSRLGMGGLRDMLRSLRKNYSDHPPAPSPAHLTPSSVSLSTDSSLDSGSRHRYEHPQIQTRRRRPKTSTGPDSVSSTKDLRPNSPYSGGSLLSHKVSPRRPSLASIFRLGQKNRPAAITNISPGVLDLPNGDFHLSVKRRSGQCSITTEEEDWDRMDSASDLDAAARALGVGPDGSATVREVRGRSPYLPDSWQPLAGPRPVATKPSLNASQSSIWAEAAAVAPSLPRSTRLSNVEENVDGGNRATLSKGKKSTQASPSGRTAKDSGKSGSVRSAPPQAVAVHIDPRDPKLAMTPENIRPLLENAREVHARLDECIGEMRMLLLAKPGLSLDA